MNQSDRLTQNIQDLKKPKTFLKMKLNPGISVKNFIGSLIHYFLLSFIFVSVDSLQPMMLEKFKINHFQLKATKNTLVIVFDISIFRLQVIKIFTAPIYGYLTDRFGRKIFLIWGILSISISMSLMGLSPNFWIYCLLRIFFAQGAMAISVIPFLADYIDNQKKGTASSLYVFMSSIGALCAAFLIFSLLTHFTNDQSLYVYLYIIIAGIILVIGLIYSVGLIKGGNKYYTKQNTKKNCKKMYEVFLISIKKKQILMGYFCSFLARSDSILMSMFLVLWSYEIIHQSSKQQAMKNASKLSGITYTIIMFCTIVYGLIFQRKQKIQILMICMLILTALGCLCFNFSYSNTDIILYLGLALLGLGMSGLLTGALYLINKYAIQQHRGYITGISTIFGLAGISIQIFIGSVLFDFINKNGPFNLFLGSSLIILILVIITYRIKKNQQDQYDLYEKNSSIILKE